MIEAHAVQTKSRRLSRPSLVLALALFAVLILPDGAAAQPFGSYLSLTGAHAYIQIPASAALNPTGPFTIEAWVALRDTFNGGCSSIAGKGYREAWWVGVCGNGPNNFRSYLRGLGSAFDAGHIPQNVWTHIAVVWDGTRHRHYINGEDVGSRPEPGPSTGPDPVRIGSDFDWEFTPTGGIDEVRFWNVARTAAQIRSTINVPLTTPQPGLVAVWTLNGVAADVIGPHDGAIFGAGFLTLPVGTCTPNATTLCLNDRFQVRVNFRTGTPATGTPGTAQVVTSCTGATDSGLFQFFGPNNWEILVKVLNACGPFNRYWVYAASATDLFYRMEVYDTARGAQKIYFNYPGAPAPALTDANAFATCP